MFRNMCDLHNIPGILYKSNLKDIHFVSPYIADNTTTCYLFSHESWYFRRQNSQQNTAAWSVFVWFGMLSRNNLWIMNTLFNITKSRKNTETSRKYGLEIQIPFKLPMCSIPPSDQSNHSLFIQTVTQSWFVCHSALRRPSSQEPRADRVTGSLSK